MEDMEVLEYLLSTMSIHQEMLYKILKKKEVKDEVYDLIRNNIMEYKKFIISIKRMILTRNSKYEFKRNILYGVASELEANSLSGKKEEFLLNLKENSKISILDIGKIRKDYRIKSKTVFNILTRIEKFEYSNLERVSNLLGEN